MYVFLKIEAKTNIKIELENVCEIIKSIEIFMDKSFYLFEFTIKGLLEFLCNFNSFTEQEFSQKNIEKRLALLFKNFDLSKILPIINKYFEVIFINIFFFFIK